MPHPRRPDPEPMKTNDVYIAAAGTVVWLIALAVLLIIGLPAQDRWWLWVCGTGALIGIFACWYLPRLQRARAREEAEQTAERRR